jgi:hypothetical protein
VSGHETQAVDINERGIVAGTVGSRAGLWVPH